MLRFLPALVVAALLVANSAFACLNVYGTALGGAAKLQSGKISVVPAASPINREFYSNQIANLTETFNARPIFQDASDLAVAHLYLGEIDRAIELLEQAEKLKPNEYIIASNLGTAYELAGRNQEALKWIEEGIRRNPNSHDGSEWVHANLLKAKIAMASDAEWIATHSVTGAEFGSGDMPEYDASASAANCPREPSDIADHLYYQLNERRQFVPGPDPIVAALMFDLANATALTETVEDATAIYQAAGELGYHNMALLDHRISAMQELSKSNPLSGTRYDFGLNALIWLVGAFCVIVALLIAVVVVWRFMRGKKTI